MLRVIADDLTGACDVGAELAAAGLPTRVCVDGRTPPRDPAWLDVINTQSRALAASAAYERVLRLARDTTADVLLKKIDTALRGHLGAELEAALDGLGAIAAFVVPAIPAAGRVTRGGAQWFDGRLLSATEFARDPEGGGGEASVPAVLARESRKRTEVIGTSVVRAGRLPERVLALARAGTAFFVVDAETDADLTAAVSAILELPRPLCLAGSIGLARALAPQIGATAGRELDVMGERYGCGLPALIVLGSLHSMARAQIERLAEAGEASILTAAAPDAPETTHAALVRDAAANTVIDDLSSSAAKACAPIQHASPSHANARTDHAKARTGHDPWIFFISSRPSCGLEPVVHYTVRETCAGNSLFLVCRRLRCRAASGYESNNPGDSSPPHKTL